MGVFRDVGDSGNGFCKNSDYNLTARVTALPWYEDTGKRLLHLGFGYTHEFRDKDSDIRFRSRPEAHLGPRFVDTGKFKAESIDYFNPEVAAVYGPFSIQAEYVFSEVNDSNKGGDLSFDGAYIYASVFLTPG